MDQTKLQENISLYYQKLPEETKVLFAGMSWLEVLKEIDSKYSLNDKQIESLGTETTLLLLGIISLEDYEQTIRKDIILEGNKIEEILKEINEKILKDIVPLISQAFNNNVNDFAKEESAKQYDERFSSLPNEVKDAIAISGWKEKLYVIADKYNLAVDKMGLLEEITIKTLSGVIQTEQYEKEVKSQINLTDEKNKEMVLEINEAIFKKIKESMQMASTSNGNIKIPLPPYKVINNYQLPITDEIKAPLPPYKNTTPKTETIDLDHPIEPNKNQTLEKEIEISKPLENFNKQKEGVIPQNSNFSNSETDMYREHGIEIMPENNYMAPVVPNEETKTQSYVSTLNIPKKPQNTSEETLMKPNIVTEKLFNKTVSQKTVSDYSLPKNTPQLDSMNQMQNTAPAKPHDPYHEQI